MESIALPICVTNFMMFLSVQVSFGEMIGCDNEEVNLYFYNVYVTFLLNLILKNSRNGGRDQNHQLFNIILSKKPDVYYSFTTFFNSVPQNGFIFSAWDSLPNQKENGKFVFDRMSAVVG